MAMGDPGCPTLSPYTEHPTANPSVIFPNHGYQVLSSTVSLVAIALVAYIFGRRTSGDDLLTLEGWKKLGVPRFLVTMVFISTAAFVFFSAVLINGTGLALGQATCTLGVLTCIIFYALTKLFIYAFLIEKVWIVWTPRLASGVQPSRWKSTSYRMCMMGLTPFAIVIILMIVARIAHIRDDGVCIIGASPWSLIPLVVFDLLITLSLTVAFVYPLTRGDIVSPRLKRIASRTLVASIVALVTSAINLTIITVMHGHQLGWVCLTSCGTDVTVNAVVIFWVTGGTSAARSSSRITTYPAMHSLAPIGKSTVNPQTMDAITTGGVLTNGGIVTVMANREMHTAITDQRDSMTTDSQSVRSVESKTDEMQGDEMQGDEMAEHWRTARSEDPHLGRHGERSIRDEDAIRSAPDRRRQPLAQTPSIPLPLVLSGRSRYSPPGPLSPLSPTETSALRPNPTSSFAMRPP